MLAIKPQAILAGLSSFGVLYIGWSYVLILLEKDPLDNAEALVWLSGVKFVIWIASGYLTAAIAKSKGILNGAAFGLLSITILGLAHYLLEGIAGLRFIVHLWFVWASLGFALGGLGGLVWELQPKLRNR